MVRIILLLMLVFKTSLVFAQPSDAKVKSDAVGNGGGIISFKFTKSTGTRQWNSSTGNWEYVRGVQVKRKSDYPGINMIVDEDVVYQYVGNGGYSFWKVRVLSNSYEGIPNPAAKEIDDFISKDWQRFYGFYYGTIVKLWQQPALAENPEWVWHSINSVEFRMNIKFDHIISGRGVETQEAIWKVRLYRDDPKAPWKNMLALRSEEAADIKVVGFKNYTPQQLDDFEKQTLQYTMAEQKARQSAAALPQVNVPAFTNAEDITKYVHDVLRNGNPEKLRAVFLQLFAPGFFEDGSKVQLRAVEEQNLAQVITAVYQNKATYHQMYCQNPGYRVEQWGNGSGKKTIYITGAVNNCNSSFTIAPVNMGYKEGVAQTALKIVEYGVHVRQDAAAIDFINSFSNRKNLCKQD
ncbi:MAG: hypothetical protein IPO01_04445 [Chitinophagaceae bacterium]|nr:hypothetical protein [Chitinophagaceae bacterium]MBK8785274.1 hypothetical protein [Chitinophagaceae bacterium]MBK9484472.1 hypothetical protein [Chitinophagaceae bacterium]